MTSPARGPEPEPSLTRRVYDEESPSYIGPMSYAEYRRMDEESEMRLEYVGGVVYAMSGGTRTHSRIAVNIAVCLDAACAHTRCSAHSQGFKVRTPRGDEYVPDAFVECDPADDPPALYSAAPCLIVEVLSPSTARTDFSEKRPAYQQIPTLGAYLIVAAEWRAVHRHWRDPSGAWREELIVGEGSIPLPCPAGGVLTLNQIYARLELPSDPPPPPLRRVYERAPDYAGDADVHEVVAAP